MGAPEDPVDPNDPLAGKELELEYPCSWVYTVIAEQEDSLRAAVESIVAPLSHELRFSNRSKAGRYSSFQLEVTVHTNNERLRIFRDLQAHASIRYVF